MTSISTPDSNILFEISSLITILSSLQISSEFKYFPVNGEYNPYLMTFLSFFEPIFLSMIAIINSL